MNGRTTPLSSDHARRSQHMSPVRKPQSRHGDTVLASLRATQIVSSKPVLPAELIATILDYLPVPDLIHFALVSRRLREMVYDDTRWIQKLKAIGVWNEGEARQRTEEAMKRKLEAQRAREADEARRTGVNLASSANGVAGGGGTRRHAGSVTLFDAGVEEDRYNKARSPVQTQRRATLAQGFDDLTATPASSPAKSKTRDVNAALTVLQTVRSARGFARQEFGKIYAALAPLYLDLAHSNDHSGASLFRLYRDPEQQAIILSNLVRFAQCDSSSGWSQRVAKLSSTMGVFENAVLREFEQGYAAGDVTGRMHRYAHVLFTVNGATTATDAFISNHPIMSKQSRVGNPLECLEDVAPGHVDLNPSQRFFEKLASVMVEQATIIDQVFPPTVDVLTPFLSRMCDDIILDYLTALFDEAHRQNVESYVKAVAGTFAQALRFVASLKPIKASPPDCAIKAKDTVTQCYEKHIDLYLAEELGSFRARSEAEVTHWERELSEQEASTESFFMSNINRQAAKRDFLSSFKRVVMMPVNVLPTFQTSSSAPTKEATVADAASISIARSQTPTLSSSGTPRSVSPSRQAPTTELAAKTAIMNSRLEGIKSLFSIEVALNLTHLAKAALERAGIMVRMGGKHGDEAREQCRLIFVNLLYILGERHIKNGFDKAVGHLSSYKPREVRELREKASDPERAGGVEPLVTFFELVNVGDLIQQMIDVFYAQELVATRLTDRDDFLDPAVKEKKRFEQMLDERVAAGLNKGIDVLIDEVEYICATTQLANDFNPNAVPSSGSSASTVMDIGPSTTAQQVVAMVSGHTAMLTGSTDKNMLDVFTQEVGLRLFGALCKHFKRQRISVDGAIKLISDINHYNSFVTSLRQKPLVPYYTALRELGQIFLIYIEPPANLFSAGKRASLLSGKGSTTSAQAKELATIIADNQRYRGIFPAEEVYEFAQRRADWYLVKGDVERHMYGIGCVVM